MDKNSNLFDYLSSPDNLFLAWETFKLGKMNKPDVQKFFINLEKNIFQLSFELRSKTYCHGPYRSFYVKDPKLRHIHKAGVRDRVLHHARYTDDFVIVGRSKNYLENLVPEIEEILRDKLKLELHPRKIVIRKFTQGVDFLGYVILPHYRLVRTKTRRRIERKLACLSNELWRGSISPERFNQSLQSYLSVLLHAKARRLEERLRNQYWVV